MASFYFDGNKLRIYEVPTGASFTVDSNGYRIYSGGTNAALIRFDVQKDLWSRFQDWVAANSWAYLAFTRTGGGFRGFDELGNEKYQTNDFTLITSIGWRIVLANYPHETIFRGNLFSDSSASLFDNSRLTVHGVVPRLEGFDSLQTYLASTSGSGATAAQIWNYPDRSLTTDAADPTTIADAVDTKLAPRLDEIHADVVTARDQAAIAAIESQD